MFTRTVDGAPQCPFALVEVSPRDPNAIHVAASFIEGLVGQRPPEIDSNEVLSEDGGNQ